MADYGLKISNPNFDANQAADYELLFNSGWPSIAIAYEQTVKVVLGLAAQVVTFDHNLGFPPFAMIWVTIHGIQCTNVFPAVTSSQVLTDPYLAGSFTDPLTGLSLADGSEVTFHVKCYNVNLSEQKTYELILPGGIAQQYNPDYGIKVTKEGQDAASTDLRDYIVHSRAQSPALLAVVTDSTPDPSNPGFVNVSYTNRAGYTGWVFAFAKTLVGGMDTYTQAGLYTQAAPRLFIENTSTYRLNTAEPGGTIVVLRDPLFAPTELEVTY